MEHSPGVYGSGSRSAPAPASRAGRAHPWLTVPPTLRSTGRGNDLDLTRLGLLNAPEEVCSHCTMDIALQSGLLIRIEAQVGAPRCYACLVLLPVR